MKKLSVLCIFFLGFLLNFKNGIYNFFAFYRKCDGYWWKKIIEGEGYFGSSLEIGGNDTLGGVVYYGFRIINAVASVKQKGGK